jgi:antitoxin component of MazEF toxin-antitoxin module
MIRIPAALLKGMDLKEGDRADLRVVVQNGELVVTHLLGQLKAGANTPDYQVKLGHWNRK